MRAWSPNHWTARKFHEVDSFLGQKVPKWTQEEMKNITRTITRKAIQLGITNFKKLKKNLKKKIPSLDFG